MDNSSYSTLDQSQSNQSQSYDTTLDGMNLMGTVFSGIAYGVVFTICTLVLCARSRAYAPKLPWNTLVTCWLLMLATLSTALQLKWTQLAFVSHRQDSPSDFIKQNMNNWIYVMLNVLYVIINWTADAILVFRFFCVFGRSLRWCTLPAPLYFASLVTGSFALSELATPGALQNDNNLASWLIIYRTVSLSLCVILTFFIIGRITILDRKGCSALHRPKSHVKNVARMLVESAFLETMSTLVYVVAVGLGSPLQNLFLPILGQVQVIAPMLIMYRVVRGRAAMASGLPTHYDTKNATQPKLTIGTGAATTFSSAGRECSVSPIGSSRSDCPRYPFPPPYGTNPSSFNESLLGTIPQSPCVDPAYMWGVQKLGIKRPVFP